MNNRALSLSIVMAIAATFFVYSYVSSIEDEAKKKFGAQVLVVTAKRDIREMETINETMIQLTPVPKRFVEPASVFFEHSDPNDKEVAKSMKDLAGAVAIVPIKKDEQVSYNKLTEPNVRTGLAPQIAPGRRAVAIPVSEISGVSKLVKPGDRIDVIAVVKGQTKEGRIAKTILQDTVVLSTGRAVTNNVARVVETDAFGGKERIRNLAEETGFSSITVEVEPEQAEMLALVATDPEATLEISLRNNDDTDRVPLTSVMMDDVLGPDAMRVRAPAQVMGGRR